MTAPLQSQGNRVRVGRAVLAVVLALLAFSPLWKSKQVVAASYSGWGDTGWSYADKRVCCQSAVELAQADSIRLCEIAGGDARLYPPGNTKGTRGLCDWDGKGNGFDRVYRCTARTDVHCH